MSSTGSSLDTVLDSDFQVSTSSSPTLTSSVSEGTGFGRHSTLVAVLERGEAQADNSDSGEETIPRMPTSTASGTHPSMGEWQRLGSRGRAENRRHCFDGSVPKVAESLRENHRHTRQRNRPQVKVPRRAY